MSKKVLGLVVLVAVVGLALFAGIKIGEKQKEKWYNKYMVVVEGRAQEKMMKKISGLINGYPDILNEDERVVVGRLDYENDPQMYKLVWIKNADGRLNIGRADKWSEIPD